MAAENPRKATDVKITNVGGKATAKGEKQDSLTGGNDLQRQHDGKGRMAAAGNEV